MAREDPDYTAWLRTRHCLVCDAYPSEAHHAGRRGLGQRAHDHTAVPLCRKHHAAWHDGGEPFRRWTRDDRRLWAEDMAAMLRETYLRQYIDIAF